MEIQIALAKANKFASAESGDTLEVVDRPNGGISIVMADGRSSGKEAKSISSLVVRKVISLLAEGVRDGAAARAASDFLYTEKGGKGSAYLDILSIDLETQTVVITRNNNVPVFIAQNERIECLVGESDPIGTSRNIRPLISEIPLESQTTVVMFTDGIMNAGSQYGSSLDICTTLGSMLEDQEPTAQEISDAILFQANRLDQGHPNDDMSIVALRVSPEVTDSIRRMFVRIPFVTNDNDNQ